MLIRWLISRFLVSISIMISMLMKYLHWYFMIYWTVCNIFSGFDLLRLTCPEAHFEFLSITECADQAIAYLVFARKIGLFCNDWIFRHFAASKRINTDRTFIGMWRFNSENQMNYIVLNVHGTSQDWSDVSTDFRFWLNYCSKLCIFMM